MKGDYQELPATRGWRIATDADALKIYCLVAQRDSATFRKILSQ